MWITKDGVDVNLDHVEYMSKPYMTLVFHFNKNQITYYFDTIEARDEYYIWIRNKLLILQR